MLTTYLAEAALAPDWLIRHGIRRLLTTRLRDEQRQVVSGHADELLATREELFERELRSSQLMWAVSYTHLTLPTSDLV